MQYDPDKSHLSAELKAQFLQNCSSSSPTKAIPGVGSVTEERLADKGLHTVGELLQATDSFLELKALVGRVNAHKIFDALEPMRKKASPAASAAPSEGSLEGSLEGSSVASSVASSSAPVDQAEFLVKELEKIGLVESEDDKALEKNISSCRIT